MPENKATQDSVEALRWKIREVRERIVDLVMRMDDITLQQIPQIHADYALKIGCWEQALLDAELEARRARRRLALAQSAVNQGNNPQLGAIEKQLEEELADWVAKVEAARRAYEKSLAFVMGSRPLTSRESARLKHLYRTLAKRLHPDVCRCQKDDAESIFALVQAAYRNGDILALQALEVATRHLESDGDDLEGVEDENALAQELELVLIEEGVTQERLEALENSEEMQLGKLLANSEWVTARTCELRQAVEEWERVKRECDLRLAELRRDTGE